MVYCSRCGQPLPSGWRFCPACAPEPEPGPSGREAHLFLLLGNYSSVRHRHQLAGLFYRAALAADPGNWQALFNLGCQAWRQGDIDRALSCWEASLKLNPNNYLAHFNLGTYFLYNRQLNAARYHLTRVRRLQPGYLAARLNLGTVYLLLGFLEASRREYTFVLEHDPGHAGARRGLAMVSRITAGSTR